MVAVGSRLHERKISLTNTSVVPIIIDWHTFVVKPVLESMPFNVAFSFHTPFTDELASKLRNDKRKTNSEIHLEKHYPYSKVLHTCDSSEFSNTSDITTSSYM